MERPDLASRFGRTVEQNKIVLSIMSPVYNAEDCVDALVARITAEASKITESFEIVLVDDGSKDASWEKIHAACGRFSRVRGIRLSRNFGQHQAITAGLEACRGEYVILMDCDLQDDPKYIGEMYQKAQEGFDIVLTSKRTRAHGTLRNLASRFFRFIFNRLTQRREVSVRGDVGTFSLLTHKVVNAYLQVREYHRHYLMVLGWLGFSTAHIRIEHARRFAGRSSYSWSKLVAHALDGVTSQSDKLLYLSIKIGFVALILSISATFFLIASYFLYGYKEGWASVMVAISTSTSLILLSLGVVGIYIGKIFEQAKGRPLFIVKESVN